jgi:hypothetical protein
MSGIPGIGTLPASVSKDGAASCFEEHRSGAAMLLSRGRERPCGTRPGTQRKTCEARYLFSRSCCCGPWGPGSSLARKSGSPDLRILRCRSRVNPRSARSLVRDTHQPGTDNRLPQEIVISVICITLASARLVYGPKVAERSTMVVGPLPRPSGRFLPRLGPAAPARGASFFRVCGGKPGEEAAASHPRKKSAPAQGRRADLVIR